MSEQSVFIDSGSIKIEGLLEDLQGEKGIVVTHPHPLYGGNMHNNVVEAIVQSYREQGYSTFRFNFRGVGGSQGAYEDGVGEQEDVRAALRYLSDLGKAKIDLAGYSFGTWVNALGLNTFEQVDRMIMVSPPVNVKDFGFLSYNPKIQLVIVGSRDDIAGFKTIEEMLPAWNPDATFMVIQDADHFFWGGTDELKSIITDFLETE